MVMEALLVHFLSRGSPFHSDECRSREALAVIDQLAQRTRGDRGSSKQAPRGSLAKTPLLRSDMKNVDFSGL